MPLVAAADLAKAYGTRTVLRQVSLAVRSGERIGVVGRNGSGKSTLARILCGIEQPDQGEITRRRGARISYLDQVPGFEDDPTAEQAVLGGLAAWTEAAERHQRASDALSRGAGDMETLLVEQARAAEDLERLGGWDQRHRVKAVLGHLGIDAVEARISKLSGGEQRRVALARILIERPDLAVFDEPTNHLDADTVEWFEHHLIEDFPGAVLLITHDRYLLDRVVSRTLEISEGEAYLYEGGFELYLEQKAARLAHAARAEQNRQNFLRRELEWLRRQPKARTTKQSARVDRAQAALKAPKPKAERQVDLSLSTLRAGKTILELRDLCVAMEGRVLAEGIELFVAAGERIGIVGRNGTGKTTLLRTVVGEVPQGGGRVVLGARTRVAYFDQVRGGLDDDKSVFENAVGDQTRIEVGGQLVEPISYLERFGFDRYQQRQPVGSLSGGEKARVALAALLCQPANLILLDEPTNDLDVGTLGVLEGMLVEQNATALVVTHDRWFLDRVATAILAFEGDRKAVLYPGNYQSYQRLREEARAQRSAQQAPPPEAQAAPKARSSNRAPGRKKALNFAEQRELDALPEAIDQADTEVQALEGRLSDPKTYTDSEVDVGALTRELTEARERVEALMLRWEELEEKKARVADPSAPSGG